MYTGRWLYSLGGGGRTTTTRSCAERLPSLLDPLPGLQLPPNLHGKQQQQPPPHTQVTTVPNGVRVASQDILGPMACVRVMVDSGSVYETRWSAGVSHLLESLAFHDTKNRDLAKIDRDVEATGEMLRASAAGCCSRGITGAGELPR